MVQSEEEVLKAAQAILEQKQYQKLRNYIYVSAQRVVQGFPSHRLCFVWGVPHACLGSS